MVQNFTNLQIGPQVPRKLSKSRCHIPIGSKAHLAAYKRPRVTESEPHHHKQITLSLSFQLQIKFTNPEKSSRTFQTLTIAEAKLSQNPWIFRASSQGFNRIIITEPFLCNSSAKSIARSNESGAITEWVWEEEGKKDSRNPNQFRRRRRKSPASFQKSIQNQQQNRIQGFLKIQIESPNQNQVKITNLLLCFVQEQQRVPEQRRTARIREALVRNHKP